MLRTRLTFLSLGAVATAAATAAVVLTVPQSQATVAPAGRAPYGVHHTRVATTPTNTMTRIGASGFAAGAHDGTKVRGGHLVLATPTGRQTLEGLAYRSGQWTSAWVTPGQRFTQLIGSWQAANQRGTVLEVQVRVRTVRGKVSTFKTMARWTTWESAGFHRTSYGRQDDGIAHVATDTLVADTGRVAAAYQYRLVLLRRATKAASTHTPTVRTLQTIVSRPVGKIVHTSRILPARTLNVPRYSQMLHTSDATDLGGGGEAWCSPTSLAMILAYYHRLPAASSYAWVSKRYADRWVDEVARRTYDWGFGGTGNWPFNTGYASSLGLFGFVTRLDNLAQAERFIAAGIPLEASISFGTGQLKGAPISSTPGHLVVIVGFTAKGDVVVNDPAAASNATVRRVYKRAQFEKAWLGKSDGTVYVVRDAAHPLPATAGATSW